MADSITVDELAIKVAADATTASSSIDLLTASLRRLNTTLGPTLARLSRLGPSIARANKAAMSASARATKAAVVPSAVTGAAATVGSVAASPVGTAAANVASTAKQATDGVKKLETATNRTAAAGKAMGGRFKGSFIQIRSWVFFTLFAFTILKSGIEATIGRAVDFIETLNLFQVAMRNNTEQANAFVKSMTAAFGLDPKRVMEYQSTFFQVAESIGVTNKNAYSLSEILTRLTFDFASLRNMKLEDVFAKVQGVLSGQDRAVRALGGSIGMTTLKEVALSLGMKKNVEEMTQAEKVVIRLIALYRQSGVAQGDMARTLNQPANLLRILGDQFAITARAIGSLFIPMIQTVIPYVIYFVRAIGLAAAQLASFFGIDMNAMSFEMPAMEDATGGAAKNLDKAAGSAGKAAKSAKQLRDYMLGIDELNVLTPESDTSTGGGGGGAGGGGSAKASDMTDLLERIREEMDNLLSAPFEDMMAGIAAKLKPLSDALKPFIDTWVENLSNLWTVIQPILERIGRLFSILWKDYLVPFGEWLLSEWDKQWDTVVGVLSIAWQILEPIIDLIIDGIELLGEEAFKPLMEWLTGTNEEMPITETLENVRQTIEDLQTAASTKFEEIKTAVVEAWDFIAEKTAPVWNFISGLLKTTWGVIKAVILVPLAIIGTTLVMAWDFIKAKTKQAWDWVYDKIKGPLDAVMKFLTPTFKVIKETVRKVWDGLSAGLSKAWDTIKSVFKGGINFLIRAINNGPIAILNKIIDAAKAIDKTGLMKGVSRVSTIPLLASGGAVNTGRMFVAGEAGPELIGSFGGNNNTVMPLENSGFVEAMASAVFGAVTSAMAGVDNGSGNGDVYLDGTKVGNVLRKADRRSGINGSLVTVGAR